MGRLIFISGLGEDETIFERLRDKLPGEKIFLSLWDTLPDKPLPRLNATGFARELVNRFGIAANDIVIGHSAGGWVALHIKNLVGCRIVQIASWTDLRKVVTPIPNRHAIYFFARTGLYFNRLVLRYSVKKFYRGTPSEGLFRAVFTKLITGNRANAVNQLRLIFNPYPTPLSVRPDLVIHARGDSIVHFPDGAVHEVDGDHFSLYIHPEQVYPSILDLINRHGPKGF